VLLDLQSLTKAIDLRGESEEIKSSSESDLSQKVVQCMSYLGLWRLGLPDLHCPHLPQLSFSFFFPFMNNLYELWVEACRHEVWPCPWRETQLWQKTLMQPQLWLFCSARRQQANNSSIKVCTLDPVTNGCRGWKGVLCMFVCACVSACNCVSYCVILTDLVLLKLILIF